MCALQDPTLQAVLPVLHSKGSPLLFPLHRCSYPSYNAHSCEVFKMGTVNYKLFVGLLLLVSSVSCVHSVRLVTIHPNCPPIPETTFEKVGLDVTAGALQFGKLVTVGELMIKSDPQIISGISQSVRDDQTTDALICAAKERGELKTPEQIDHAWKVARFFRAPPTSDKTIEFFKNNPFPSTTAAVQSPKSPLKEGVSADAVRQSLIQFIEEANPLLNELDKSPTNVSEDSKRSVNRWYAQVKTFLEDNFSDPTYVHRFKNLADVPLPGPPVSVQRFNDEYLGFRGGVVSRQVRLNQFLDKLP